MNRIMPIVLILIALGIFFGYVRPLWVGDIANAKTQIQSYNDALDAASQFSAEETKLEQERDQIPADELNRLEAFLPDGVDNVQLILDLNALAGRTGMTLANFSTNDTVNNNSNSSTNSSGSANTGGFTSSTNANPVDSLTISVSGTGTYDSFRSFLAGIEQSLRPLDLTSIAITQSATGVYNYQMTFTFYWLH